MDSYKLLWLVIKISGVKLVTKVYSALVRNVTNSRVGYTGYFGFISGSN